MAVATLNYPPSVVELVRLVFPGQLQLLQRVRAGDPEAVDQIRQLAGEIKSQWTASELCGMFAGLMNPQLVQPARALRTAADRAVRCKTLLDLLDQLPAAEACEPDPIGGG